MLLCDSIVGFADELQLTATMGVGKLFEEVAPEVRASTGTIQKKLLNAVPARELSDFLNRRPGSVDRLRAPDHIERSVAGSRP